MARVYYYFIIACFYFVLKFERNVQASDSLGCQSVIAGIKMNSAWKINNDQKVITWFRKSDATTVVKSCYVSPSVLLVLKFHLGLRNMIALIYTLASLIGVK